VSAAAIHMDVVGPISRPQKLGFAPLMRSKILAHYQPRTAEREVEGITNPKTQVITDGRGYSGSSIRHMSDIAVYTKTSPLSIWTCRWRVDRHSFECPPPVASVAHCLHTGQAMSVEWRSQIRRHLETACWKHH
jgi:hypothetical protein